MATSTEQSPQLKAHYEIRDAVNQKVITALESGSVPWFTPWTATGVPRNIASGREFQGINLLLLSMAGYERNLFITFRQLQEIGGKVKRGEHGHIVCQWKYPDAEEQAAEAEGGKAKGLLRRYIVFNEAQCEDIPAQYLAKLEIPTSYPNAKDIIAAMPNAPVIKHKHDTFGYDSEKDIVWMPKKSAFKQEELYYSVLFQQLVHSTAHASRLGRKSLADKKDFSVAEYLLEDLIADLGRWYLDSLIGSYPFVPKANPEYVSRWLDVIKTDPWLLFKAASHAQKSVDYILGKKDSQGGC